MLKTWLATGALVLALGGLGALAPWWWPPLAELAGTHSARIEGLAGMIQIAIWGVALLVLFFRFVFLRRRQRPEPSSTIRAENRGSGSLAQGDENVMTGAGGIAIGKVEKLVLNAGAGPADSQRIPPSPSAKGSGRGQDDAAQIPHPDHGHRPGREAVATLT